MKHIILIAIILFSISAFPKDYFITSGESLYLPVSPSSRITVGNSSIISIKDLGSKIKISGKKKGISKLKIGSKQHKIYIMNALEKDLYLKLKTLINSFKGLKIKILNKKITIEGELLRVSDYEKIKTMAATHKQQIVWQAKLHKSIALSFTEYLKSQLDKMGITYQSINSANQVYLHKDYKKTQLEKLYPGVLFTYLNHTPMMTKKIKTQLYFLEMSRSAQSKLGINWEQNINKQLLPSTKTSGALTAFISALEDTGSGKLLAKPKLITNSGTSAQFLAGGEFPIRSYNKENSGSISWKTYGIKLDIKPTLYNEKIHLDITSETSNIDPSTTIDGVPGIKTNKVTSTVTLDNKEISSLSGVYKLENLEGIKKIPLLSEIPILGELFKSRSFMKRESDLIILIQAEAL